MPLGPAPGSAGMRPATRDLILGFATFAWTGHLTYHPPALPLLSVLSF